MMPARLFNKHTPALNLFLFTLKKNLPLMLLGLAFMALVNPGLFVSYLTDNLQYYSYWNPYDLTEMTTIIGLGTTAATAGLSMLFCLINFSYLYKKPAGDVFHALPISRTKLLLARYFASVLPVLAPALLSYTTLSLVCLSDKVTGDLNYIWAHAGLNLGIVLVMSAMTTVFLVCAGNMFSFFASLGGVNAGVPILVFIGISLAENYLHGYVADYDVMYYCTPAFFAFSRYQVYDQGPNAFWLQLPWLLLIAAVCLLAAILLYNRRKSEKSGETYAFPFVYYAVSVLISAIGGYVIGLIFGRGNYDISFWVFGLIGSLLTAIAFGALTDKGFKTVKRSAILGGCAYLLMLTFTVGTILDISGFEKRIPQANAIEEVTVGFPYDSMSEITFTDPSDVIALHQAALEPYDVSQSYLGGTIELTYKLKTGAEMKRRYHIQTERSQIAFYNLLLNKEYQAQTIKQFTDLAIDPLWNASYGMDGYINETDFSAQLTKDEALRVLELYFADLKAGGAESMLEPVEDNTYVYLHGYATVFVDGKRDDAWNQSAGYNINVGNMPQLRAYLSELVETKNATDPAQ